MNGPITAKQMKTHKPCEWNTLEKQPAEFRSYFINHFSKEEERPVDILWRGFIFFYLNCTNKTTAFKLQANETATTEHLGHINDMWHSRRMETKRTSLQMSAESTACGGHSFVL